MNAPVEPRPTLAVVIVTYNSAAEVARTLVEVSKQLGQSDELVVVDNASADATREAVRKSAPSARILEQGRNLGFAAGCNIGVEQTTAELLLLLNPDAPPAPGCIEALRHTAVERPTWGAWQALVTMAGGTKINTAGNVTHFLGMGWAGRCGDPVVEAPIAPIEVDFASGAALVVRREAWKRVGGFDERYFMYGEDLDIALRLWSTGWAVGLEPNARVEHDYEFAKGDRKWFLLERNRWWTVISDYPGLLLVLLLPALLTAELALIIMAVREGWLCAKLRSQVAVLRDLPAILRRRRKVQASRTATAAEFARRLSSALDSPYLGRFAQLRAVAALQDAYWAAVRTLLGGASSNQ